jgi:hypothetical protein
MTTYIQLINKVETRLRQTNSSSLSDPGASLIGHFVNQAKEEIEDIGPWKALRTECTFTTVAGTETATTGTTTNERSYVHCEKGQYQVFETTSNALRRVIKVVDLDVLRSLHETDTSQGQQRPDYVAFAKTSSGLVAHFYPLPDAVYTFKAVVVIPQAELAITSTAITIPATPVWMLAAAYAAIERGEELSGEPNSLMEQARRAIDRAVLTDFGAEENSFYVD